VRQKSKRGEPQSHEEKSAALEKLFRELPIPPEQMAALCKYFIPSFLRHLMFMIPNSRVRGVRTKNGLRSAPLKIRPAEKGLRRLADATKRTLEALDTLPETAREALNYKPGVLWQLRGVIGVLKASADMAAEKIAEQKKVRGNAGRGRPPQTGPSPENKIAAAVALHYEILTGKRPTGTSFVRFLAAVYEVLGSRLVPDRRRSIIYQNK
jgi:hypothetical protein